MRRHVFLAPYLQSLSCHPIPHHTGSRLDTWSQIIGETCLQGVREGHLQSGAGVGIHVPSLDWSGYVDSQVPPGFTFTLSPFISDAPAPTPPCWPSICLGQVFMLRSFEKIDGDISFVCFQF